MSTAAPLEPQTANMTAEHDSTETPTAASHFIKAESAWTENSNFADSAIDMNANDAQISPVDSGPSDLPPLRDAQSLSPISQSLADRMRRLAASAWTLEQDDDMPEEKRQQIEKQLRNLEITIEGASASDSPVDRTEPSGEFTYQDNAPMFGSTQEFDGDDWVSESDLYKIHDNLGEVVASMRLRQQEQRHLHQLTATKIEAVAQRCLFQEQQMQELVAEVRSLRLENKLLGRENDTLRDTVAELESEASKKEVAVSAMTSAVAGLEGWIDDAHKAQEDSCPVAIPLRDGRQRRAVVKGKGRFRGRYYVDEENNRYSSASPDARELQDGVRAWIRGFRDVEDACSSPVRGSIKESYQRPGRVDEDDWGEFQSPPHPS